MSEASHVPSPPDPAPTPSRRQFLLGAAGMASLAVPGAARAQAAPRSARAEPNWAQLERTLKGPVLRPGQGAYEQAIKIRNLRYAATRPAGVAMVTDANDVATAIAWAQDNRVDLVSRSGGHSYAGYSTTPGLVINLNGMKKVSVDRAKGTMTITGAATNQDVEDAGKCPGVTIPGGQCPTVGIAGFALGGGMGFYMRQHGLAIDSLSSTEIVTADGQVRQVVRDEKPCDLFWALCGGGGGNFGINTSFTFRTFAVPERVTIFSLKWDDDACIKAFHAFQEVLLHGPDSLGAIAHFGTKFDASGAVRPYLRIFGQVVESKQVADRLLAPVIAAAKLAEPPLVEEKDFWAAKDYLGEGPGSPNAFAERSRFHPGPLSDDGVRTVLIALTNAPIRGTKHAVSSSFFAWGGAVARVAPDATAFVHRKDVWLQAFGSSWGSETGNMDRLLAWQDAFYDKMGAYASDRAYQNFTDPRLKRPLEAYYGENLPCLVKVKRQYDPSNVFKFAQSIPV